MSLLPVPRPESWEHTDLAEAHALLAHGAGDEREAVDALLRLFRLAILRQQTTRAALVLADAEHRLSPEVDPERARALRAERLRWRVRELREVADVAGIHADAQVLLAECGPDEIATRARVLFCLGQSAAWTAEDEQLFRAADWLSEAVGLYRVLDEPELCVEALASLGYMVYAALRQYERAVATLERCVDLLPADSSARGVHLSYLAECLTLLGRLDEARAALREAHEIGLTTGDDRLIGYAAWEQARIADAIGDAGDCDRWIREAERHPGDWFGGKAGSEFLADQVFWAVRQGREDAATRRLGRLLARAGSDALLEGQELGAQGMLALLEGRAAEAARLIGRHLELGYAESRRWHWEILRGDALLAAGDVEGARSAAHEASHELELIGHPEFAASLEAERWARLEPLLTPAAGTPHVLLRLLGTASTVVGHRELPLPSGHPTVLVGLLALSGRPMSLDEAGELLWPETDPEIGRRRLRNVLARLRRATPIVEREREALRLAPGVRVDAVEFERAARSAIRAGSAEGRGIRVALDRYAGPLLPGVADERIEAHRRRLELIALGLHAALADTLLEAGDLAGAAAEIDAVLALDPFDDEPAIRMARAYAIAGDGATARTWEARARMIADALGA